MPVHYHWHWHYNYNYNYHYHYHYHYLCVRVCLCVCVAAPEVWCLYLLYVPMFHVSSNKKLNITAPCCLGAHIVFPQPIPVP